MSYGSWWWIIFIIAMIVGCSYRNQRRRQRMAQRRLLLQQRPAAPVFIAQQQQTPNQSANINHNNVVIIQPVGQPQYIQSQQSQPPQYIAQPQHDIEQQEGYQLQKPLQQQINGEVTPISNIAPIAHNYIENKNIDISKIYGKIQFVQHFP
eukprot:399487_1